MIRFRKFILPGMIILVTWVIFDSIKSISNLYENEVGGLHSLEMQIAEIGITIHALDKSLALASTKDDLAKSESIKSSLFSQVSHLETELEVIFKARESFKFGELNKYIQKDLRTLHREEYKNYSLLYNELYNDYSKHSLNVHKRFKKNLSDMKMRVVLFLFGSLLTVSFLPMNKIMRY